MSQKEKTNADTVNHIIKILDDSHVIETNDVWDGYHTFGELYDHRIMLYIALCKIRSFYWHDVWLSLNHSNGTAIFGWFILGISKEAGKQITYHIPEKYLGKLAGNPNIEILDQAPEYDGHTSSEVLERLSNL